ncbi:uncharacterized protein LOC143628919 [Bidens hawaiensis]|uniref:uncharacterized protein LOC143628919 n=1 Tax=Bidens hawaiensis TaxID=980011 RepID=UPI0040497648
MPKCARFLKDILTNKQKLAEVSSVPLSVGCSAVLQSKLPEKMADPGSFTILCILGDDTVSQALADLGASINLIPYSVFSRLGLDTIMTHVGEFFRNICGGSASDTQLLDREILEVAMTEQLSDADIESSSLDSNLSAEIV